MSDAIEDIYRLKRLRDQGGISEEQYEAQREAALARAARKGTATGGRGTSAGVAALAGLAIAASVGALVLVMDYRHVPATPAPVAETRHVTPPLLRQGSVPLGMSTWDGAQSMSPAGSQDMTPPTPDDGDRTTNGTAATTAITPLAQDASVTPPATPTAPVSSTPVQSEPTPGPAAPPPVPETRVAAGDLSQAFQNDATGAAGRLSGHQIVVTGAFDKATLDVPDYPAIDLQGADPQHDVGINLEKSSAARAAQLTPGERVTATCQSVTALAGIPMLDHCTL